MRIVLFIVILIRLVFVVEFASSDQFDLFSIELAESESEDTDNQTQKCADEFLQNSLSHTRLGFANRFSYGLHTVQIEEARFKEILSPPPQSK